MEEIVVTFEGNKIIGTTKSGHRSFTIIPAHSSIDDMMRDMVRDSDRDYVRMIGGFVLSGLLYDDDECLEHAEYMMKDHEKSLKRRAENHMVQCLDIDYAMFSDCGEVNCTKLAEEAAKYLDHDEWLDEETHWVWSLAVDVSENYTV